jgi:RND family efflux transporter MFP subunit
MRQTRVASLTSFSLVLTVFSLATTHAFAQDDPAVLVKKVGPGVLERSIRQSAILVPLEEAPLRAKVSGYVSAVNVDIGDVVKKDDVLVVVDVPEIEQQLAAATASVGTAAARVARADSKVGLERARYQITKALAERKARTQLQLVESRAEMDLAQAEADLARAEESEAKANASRIQATIGYATIRAPFDGIIVSRMVHPGVLVGAGGPANSFLVRIERRDRLRCRVEIPEKDALLVLESQRLGTLSMKLELDALPGVMIELDAEICKGGAAHFANSLHPKAHHMLAEFDVDNESGRLISGLFGNVEITAQGKTDQRYVLVPNTAIRAPRKGTPHVFTVASMGGKTAVMRVDVNLHGTDGRETQVTGLGAGSIVIVRGGADLQHGDSVTASTEKGAGK